MNSHKSNELQTWLNGVTGLSERTRDAIRHEMVAIYEGDPELYSKEGWAVCYRAAKTTLEDRLQNHLMYGCGY